MTPEQQALVARLDAFIRKLDERLEQILYEADAGVQALIQQRQGELTPVRNALGAIDALTRQLTDKLEATWDGQIEDMFKAQGNALWDLGLDRKEDARQTIELEVERFKLAKESECLRATYPAVQAAIEKTHPCHSCGAPLQLKVPYEAESLTCSSCGVVNQLMPEPIVSNYFLFGQQVFPAVEAQPIRAEIERYKSQLERELRDSKGAGSKGGNSNGAAQARAESAKKLKHLETLERSYWELYAATKARFLSQPVDTELIESQMDRFRKSLK